MNWEALGAISELVGAIGVIATLGYLAFQIRQNSHTVKTATAQSVMAAVNETLQTGAASPQAARMLMLGQTDFEALSDDEKMQFAVWLLSWFRIMDQAYQVHRLGTIDPGVWDGYFKHLQGTLQADSVRRWWSNRRMIFTPAFRELIDAAANSVVTEDHVRSAAEVVTAMHGASELQVS
jgi:hypothetical protein